MKIAVYGLGYVGCVSSACLANAGWEVTGIDVDSGKVEAIGKGRSPIIEPGLEEALGEAVSSGRLRASTQARPADVSIVCVGTPSRENGSLDLQYVRRVSEQIGRGMRQGPEFPVAVIRSTVLPGTVEEVVAPLLEKGSGRRAGEGFGICVNPEFMREGSSLEDYRNPPFTVIGEGSERAGDMAARLYENIDAPLIRTDIRSAEMVKYSCNAFHALKVTFANEVGNLCKALGIDSHVVMDILCRDDKLNLSPYYLKPGFAFGGSCLPKDLRAMLYKVKELDLESPLLRSVLPSNRHQVEAAFRAIRRGGCRKVGVLGLSFKPGSDDLRESPTVELVERLIGKGYEVSIYDREVSLARIFGANRRYIERVIPHVSSLMKETLDEVVCGAEILVIAKKDQEFAQAVGELGGGKRVLDLVRIVSNPGDLDLEGYEGICW